MRPSACSVDPPEWHQPHDNVICVKLRNVTPIFGGGYAAREVDPECLIRPAAIRGQLRFWWRATAGAQFETPEQLFKEEEAIWGSARKRGAVSVSTRVLTRAADAQSVRIDNCRDIPNYVRAIIIQERASSDAHRDALYPRVYLNIEFAVTISAESAMAMSEATRALNAFVLYGGIGGRTRRGFGCLEASCELPAETTYAAGEPAGQLSPPVGFPSLVGARLYVGPPADAIQSWATAVAMLKRFRGAVAPGSRDERPRSGKLSHSPWPEADAIRILRGIKQVNGSGGSSDGALSFPRAQLGLPFKLQSLRDHTGSFGKADVKLRSDGKLADRLASPVVVRPIMISGSWRPAVLIFNCSPIPDDRLAVDISSDKFITASCSGWPASLYKDGTEVAFNHGCHNTLDALAAFMMLPGAGWQEQRIDVIK